MDLNDLLTALSEPAKQNSALRLLESVVVDPDERLVQRLSTIVAQPTSIEDTNRFASLLADLGTESFIAPLINAISLAQPGSPWLADYMYALVRLLLDRHDAYPTDESFVRLMGDWLLSTGGGELSWKAGDVLAELGHPATREYLVRGAADAALFNGTRIACLRGLVNRYPDDATAVLDQLLNDPDEHIREAVADARAWLNRPSV